MALSDYPLVIKNPIDLGTIKKKLTMNRYQYVEEVLDDIQLVWDNCKTYNSAGSVKIKLFSGFILLLTNLKNPQRKCLKTIFLTFNFRFL
jgi:hypothetical protein